jgi:hypothetical protein
MTAKEKAKKLLGELKQACLRHDKDEIARLKSELAKTLMLVDLTKPQAEEE